MILNTIQYLTKVVEVKEGVFEEVPTGKYKILKREFEHISDFQEMLNERNLVYKSRCLLRDGDNWIIVQHSFEELYKLKYPDKKIGYESNQDNKRNSKRK